MSTIVNYPGPYLKKGIAEGWDIAFNTTDKTVVLDISEINFVTLFDWITVVTLIERTLTNPSVESFKIDVKGTNESNHLPLNEYIEIKNRRPTKRFIPRADFDFSRKVYNLLGFTEALGTLDIINRSSEKEVYYPGIKIEDVRSHTFYSDPKGEPTVLLGLTRLNSKEDCKQFLDEKRILNWRKAMAKRFADSPLFDSEEVWRVLCHEFAVNIWEHAEVPGFITMRVVTPIDTKTGKFHNWCRSTYPEHIKSLFRPMKEGFLELCIGDAGKGFIETLEDSYKYITGNEDRDPENILAFAFDELGTCKDQGESWATERHALNRILHITAKYGGVLTVRSAGVELIYVGKGKIFEKNRSGWGYAPDKVNKLPGIIPGAQFQVILPLVPLVLLEKRNQRKSVLETSLPSTFHTEDDQVRGHLVPLLEKLDQPEVCIGGNEQRRFREKCEELSRELFNRSQLEPLILDFSRLKWPAGQFETLLHFMQNILQHRPVLLVEIAPDLAREVIQLEGQSAPTKLNNDLVRKETAKKGRHYGEVSEYSFLETYNRIHATVMGIDQDGKKYIFGLRDHNYEAPLLSLIDSPRSVKELCAESQWGEILKENVLKAILNNINPMFEVDKNGCWHTVWGARELANEVSRVMSLHFDEVVKRCNAWRGYPYEKERKKFKIPWQKEWRENFLEGSRILSRGRHSDEVAQRLIYRLEKGLKMIGKTLGDVNVLACVTAPSMLLASFLHRWWPSKFEKPAVSDLGYYVMLSDPKKLPSIIETGGIVVVQDIIDKGKISGYLVNVLQVQDLDILCILSFIKMVPGLNKTRVTSIDKGWLPAAGEDEGSFIPKHAMIEVESTNICTHPKDEEEKKHSFWIEPRTLRPVRYAVLRRQPERGRDPDIDRRNEYLERFDKVDDCLFAAGHYVYGHRHFKVTVDVQQVLRGKIGSEIALWLADICENRAGREKKDWESTDGFSLEGDITAVLMPLHSQIHYIWPKVDNILAQRGRRQVAWLLDATLFSGRGPIYQIPPQFKHQVSMSVDEAISAKQGELKRPPRLLRILILDDTIASGRTAETIIIKILRIIKAEFNKRGQDVTQSIKWIRYFCILNQMEYSRHTFWKNLKSIGDTSIKLVFEEYAPFMGVPIYTEKKCPVCSDNNRLKGLMATCEQYGIESARKWAEVRIKELQPVAIDSPGFNSSKPVSLKRGIEILGRRKKEKEVGVNYLTHSSTAIWRFYELMYLSYPPGDVLHSLKDAWSKEVGEKTEYERYRWAVFEWCIRNWKRVEASAAVDIFIVRIKQEIERNTPLIFPILDACSSHYEDPDIVQLIAECVDTLEELESQRISRDRGADPDRIEHTTNLYTALALFWLNIPANEWEELHLEKISDMQEKIRLIDYIDQAAKALDPIGHSFLRNLHQQLKRPKRHSEPQWVLDTIAESLFRGRDPVSSKHGNHHLLPKLISDILKRGGDEEDRLLLYSSLTLFLAALEDILHYDYQLSMDTSNVRYLSEKVLEWLKHPANSKGGSKLPIELRYLSAALSLEGKLCKEFNRTFHEDVESLRIFFEKRVKELGAGRLDFTYVISEVAKRCRVLIHGQRLRICLSNIAIDRIEKVTTRHKSRIEVDRVQDERNYICFRILTNFSTIEETRKLTGQGENIKTDQYRLGIFGAKFADDWEVPSDEEKKAGFTASCKIKVPSGFVTRRK